jgi:hypothetical protein
MLAMRDVSRGDSKQPQNAYQLDFVQPLVTLAQADQAQAQLNSAMSQINAGVPSLGQTTGLASTVAQPPSLATPSVAPVASALPAAGVTAAGPISNAVNVAQPNLGGIY